MHLQKDDANKKKKQMDLWTNSSAAEKLGTHALKFSNRTFNLNTVTADS